MCDCLLSGCGAEICYIIIIGGVSLFLIIPTYVVLVSVIYILLKTVQKAIKLITELKAQPKAQEQEQQKSHSGRQKEEQKKEQKLSDHVVGIVVILYRKYKRFKAIYKAIWTWFMNLKRIVLADVLIYTKCACIWLPILLNHTFPHANFIYSLIWVI